MHYFLHSAFGSYIITWVCFCREDSSKRLLKNVLFLVTLPGKLFSENSFFILK